MSTGVIKFCASLEGNAFEPPANDLRGETSQILCAGDKPHQLSKVPYEDLTPERIKLPPRQKDSAYTLPPVTCW